MKRWQINISAVIILGMMAGLVGCYPKEEGSASDFDVVITAYDSAYNFSSITTYFMADTVIAIIDPDHPENNFTYGHTYDSVILSEMAAQLNALGYQRVPDTAVTKPDVAVMVKVMATTSTAYVYYPWISADNFSIGTLIASMSDTLNIVWLGAVNGVTAGSNLEPRIQQGIQQVFKQSPYL